MMEHLTSLLETTLADQAARFETELFRADGEALPAVRQTRRLGVYYEALRLAEVRTSGLERVLSRLPLDEAAYTKPYMGFPKGSEDFGPTAHTQPKLPGEFKPDILLDRVDRPPHIIEVKFRGRTPLGFRVGDFNVSTL